MAASRDAAADTSSPPPPSVRAASRTPAISSVNGGGNRTAARLAKRARTEGIYHVRSYWPPGRSHPCNRVLERRSLARFHLISIPFPTGSHSVDRSMPCRQFAKLALQQFPDMAARHVFDCVQLCWTARFACRPLKCSEIGSEHPLDRPEPRRSPPPGAEQGKPRTARRQHSKFPCDCPPGEGSNPRSSI